jgi:Na+-driven multidrug efflux pump
MATPIEARPQALAYLRITMLSMPFTCATMMVGMGLRGSGDSTTPMVSSIVAVLLDIGLNPLLIRGVGPIPALGVAGSALSSATASLIGAGLMIGQVYWRNLPLRLRGAELRFLIPTRAELGYMIAKGLPMGAQTMFATAAGLVMVGLVNRQGLLAAAAYGGSLQLWNYLQMPAIALGSATSTMVSQNIGARQHGRIGAITGAGMVATLGVTGSLTAIILLFDAPILGLFLGHGSPAVPLAEHMQWICTWSFVLSGMMMALFATMRAYGSVIVPLVVMVVGLYPVRLGFYYLAFPHIGGEAVYWAYPAGSVCSVALALLAYRFGGWRKIQREAIRSQRSEIRNQKPEIF